MLCGADTQQSGRTTCSRISPSTSCYSHCSWTSSLRMQHSQRSRLRSTSSGRPRCGTAWPDVPQGEHVDMHTARGGARCPYEVPYSVFGACGPRLNAEQVLGSHLKYDKAVFLALQAIFGLNCALVTNIRFAPVNKSQKWTCAHISLIHHSCKQFL